MSVNAYDMEMAALALDVYHRGYNAGVKDNASYTELGVQAPAVGGWTKKCYVRYLLQLSLPSRCGVLVAASIVALYLSISTANIQSLLFASSAFAADQPSQEKPNSDAIGRKKSITVFSCVTPSFSPQELGKLLNRPCVEIGLHSKGRHDAQCQEWVLLCHEVSVRSRFGNPTKF